MGRFENRVVLITGAARGQGRAHARAFAREGADVAICDICHDVATVPYPLGTEADLQETASLIEAEDRRTITGQVDVRDWEQVRDFTARTIVELGKLDILVANAGILCSPASLDELSEEQFDDMIGTNLKGPWHSIKAAVPHMVERQYGRIVVTASTMSFNGAPYYGDYTAAKHGVLGLVKALALEQGENGITANAVCPTTVNTGMVHNDALYNVFDAENPGKEAMIEILTPQHAMGEPWIEPEDVSDAVLFLASDDAAKITGSTVTVDMGWCVR